VYLLADIGDSVDRGWDEFFVWLPRLVGFLAILLIGYIVAKIVERIVTRLLRKGGLDQLLERGTAGSFVMRAIRSPSGLLGTLSFWAVFLGALSIAVDVLGIAALEDLVHSVWAYIPNVLAALLIFVVAGLIATAVVELVDRTMGDTPTGGIVKAVAPVLVMAIAVFMILDQLEIAPTIVTITYAALLGAVALGMALAFGLGGRDVAGRMVESAYLKGRGQGGRRPRRQNRSRTRQGSGLTRRRPSRRTTAAVGERKGPGSSTSRARRTRLPPRPARQQAGPPRSTKSPRRSAPRQPVRFER
jgi:hypothetical protein